MVRSLVPLWHRAPRSLFDLQSEMESLFQHPFASAGEVTPRITPRINLVETEHGYEVSAELPGLNPEDVKVELENGQLMISGEVKSESGEEGKTFHQVERWYGQFQRLLNVPDTLDEQHIEAEFTNGVLRIQLPKAEKVRPKKIEVKSSK